MLIGSNSISRRLSSSMRTRILWCIFSKVSAHYGKTHIMMKSLRIAKKYINKRQSHFDSVAGEKCYAQYGDTVN